MQYDIIIIGAGIVGLSTAYKILGKNPGIRLLILEKEQGVAMHQTERLNDAVAGDLCRGFMIIVPHPYSVVAARRTPSRAPPTPAAPQCQP